MSVEYILYNKPLSKKEILEKTNFKIEIHYDSEWIVDGKSSIRISRGKDDEIYEFENHAFKDVTNIMDTLVSLFNVTFYTDNELHESWYLQDKHPNQVYDFKKACVDAMFEEFGYDVIDVSKGIVIIPKRD